MLQASCYIAVQSYKIGIEGSAEGKFEPTDMSSEVAVQRAGVTVTMS